MKKFDLWPVPKRKTNTPINIEFDWEKSREKCLEIETVIDAEGCAVLFPSCRAGIYTVLEYLGAKRDWHVGISEWSSHCVIDAVGRLAMPETWIDEQCKIILVNHQWGQKKTLGFEYKGEIIEDSCDSLIGNKTALFPNNGRFETFSLPKILATQYGGVVLCRDKNDSEGIRKLRDSRDIELAIRQYNLKTQYYQSGSTNDYIYWNNNDAENGYLPLEALTEIEEHLFEFSYLFEKRKYRTGSIFRALGYENTIKEERTPCAIPIPYNEMLENDIQSVGFDLPIRHFNFSSDFCNGSFEKCIAIPIHQDVSDEEMRVLINIIHKRKEIIKYE